MRHEIIRPDGSEEITERTTGERLGLAVIGGLTIWATAVVLAPAFMGGSGIAVVSSGGGSGGATAAPEYDSVPCLFCSNWGNSTGSTDAALRDGTIWNAKSTNAGTYNTVYVADDSLGAGKCGTIPADFPTNVIKLQHQIGSSGHIFSNDSSWATPAVGDSLFFRLWICQVADSIGEGSFSHGFQSNTGAIEYQFNTYGGGVDLTAATEWRIRLRLDGQSDSYNLNGLPKFKMLRLEWQLKRPHADTVHFAGFDIYDESVSPTAPQWTASDFLSEVSGTLATSGNGRWAATSVRAAFSQYEVGWNDALEWPDLVDFAWYTGMYVSNEAIGSFVPNGGN